MICMTALIKMVMKGVKLTSTPEDHVRWESHLFCCLLIGGDRKAMQTHGCLQMMRAAAYQTAAVAFGVPCAA